MQGLQTFSSFQELERCGALFFLSSLAWQKEKKGPRRPRGLPTRQKACKVCKVPPRPTASHRGAAGCVVRTAHGPRRDPRAGAPSAFAPRTARCPLAADPGCNLPGQRSFLARWQMVAKPARRRSPRRHQQRRRRRSSSHSASRAVRLPHAAPIDPVHCNQRRHNVHLQLNCHACRAQTPTASSARLPGAPGSVRAAQTGRPGDRKRMGAGRCRR